MIKSVDRDSPEVGCPKRGSHLRDAAQGLPCLDHCFLTASVLLHLHVVEDEQGEEVPILEDFRLRHHMLQLFDQVSRFFLEKYIITKVSQHWIGQVQPILAKLLL